MARVQDMDPETKEEFDKPDEQPEAVTTDTPVADTEVKAEDKPEAEPVKERVEISLGEEPVKPNPGDPNDHQTNNSAFRALRDRKNELDRLWKEEKKKREELEAKYAPQQTTELEPRPTLADAGYDEETFSNRLLEWTEKKRKIEAQKAEQQREIEEANQIWQSAQDRYVKAKESLALDDFEDYEAIVDGKFSQVQRGILLRSSQSAHLVYAIGKSPAEVERLSKIKDPVEFAWAVRDLETGKLKVGPAKPKPEQKVVSSAAVSTTDYEKRLDELREEARRTGNYDKVMAFKKANKAVS